MNKREKRLLVVTALIVVVGLFSLLGEEEAPPAIPPVGGMPAAAVAPPTTMLGKTIPVAYSYTPDALANLLSMRAQPQVVIPDTDPFMAGEENTNHTSTRRPNKNAQGDEFHLNGVFLSSQSRGAIINGVSYFEGDWLDPKKHPNTQLLTVGDDQVELKVKERRITVPLRVIPTPTRKHQ